jgi:hypothetical protein
MSATAGPITRADRSRQRVGLGVGPMYSRARFMPPTIATAPSTTMILRCSRRFARTRLTIGMCHTGMNHASLPPARVNAASGRRLARHLYSESSNRRTSIPARALRSSASRIAWPTSSLPRISVDTWIDRSAASIVAMIEANAASPVGYSV